MVHALIPLVFVLSAAPVHVWAFHGAKDSLAPIGGDQELIDALKALGNIVRFTVLSGRDHDILDVYENQELYSWFLEHVRPVK